jgi:dienelactone hydrolase
MSLLERRFVGFIFILTFMTTQACVSTKLEVELGDYAIGTREFVLKSCMVLADGERSCPPTEILIQSWYPAEVKAEPFAPYILNSEVAVPALSKVAGAPEFLLKKVAGIQNNSHLNAGVSTKREKYPLILFSHGYHSLRMQNTALLEQLASQGNIVLSVQHVYDAAVTVMPDGRVLASVAPTPDTKDLDLDDRYRGGWTNRRVGEDRAVLKDLDKIPGDLARAIDKGKIAVMGHSMGGSTITAVCREEDNLKACINLDGPLRGSRQKADLKHPILFIEAAYPQYENAAEEKFYKNRIAEFKTTAKQGYLYLRLKDSGHLNFTDYPLVSSFPLNWFSRSYGSLDRGKSVAINYFLVKSFLDHAFAGEKLILSDSELQKFDEVELLDQAPIP